MTRDALRLDDLDLLESAQRALLSPLEHAAAETWVGDILEALRPLFEAERGVVTFTDADGGGAIAADVSAEGLAEYAARYAASDRAGAIVTARPARYYVEADVAGSPEFEAHTRSAVYTEWYRPHRLTRALGMFALGSLDWVPDLYTSVPAPVVANVLLAGSPYSRGPGAERGRALLRLLEPSFRAGVESRLAWRGRLSTTLAALDHLGRPAVVTDWAGRVLHRTPGATALMNGDAGAAVRDAVSHVAVSVGAALAGSCAGPRVREVWTARGRCWVYGCVYPESVGSAPLVLVSIDPGAPPLPPADVLRVGWGLSHRQAEVAGLLARGLSDGEIASALGISVHTARRHTEAVLSKLDLHDRRDVAGALVKSPGA